MNTSSLLSSQFQYSFSNLAAHTPGLVEVILGCIVGIGIVALLRYGLLYIHGLILIRADQGIIESKKKVLADLILMKDIQTEMEKEIEQASLKATFQS